MTGRFALGAYFFLHGVVGTSWLFAMTTFTSRFANPDDLGQGIGVGLVVLLGVVLAPLGMPLGGWLAGRWGARVVAIASAVVSSLVLGGAAFAGSLGVLVLAMVGLAVANGALFVAMNLLAAGVEGASGRLVLPWCHGLLALGGLVGGLLATQLISAYVPQLDQLAWTAVISLVLAAGLAPLLPHVELDDTRPRMPQNFLLLAGVAFAAGVAVNVVRDSLSWRLEGAVSLSGGDVLWLGMAVGGLLGGAVAARIGVRNVLYAGAGLTALGLVWFLIEGGWDVSPAGFMITGLGLSCLFPLALSLAASSGSTRHAVTAVAVIGYLGKLAGTPLFWLVGGVRNPTFYLLVVLVLAVGLGLTLSRGSARAPR